MDNTSEKIISDLAAFREEVVERLDRIEARLDGFASPAGKAGSSPSEPEPASKPAPIAGLTPVSRIGRPATSAGVSTGSVHRFPEQAATDEVQVIVQPLQDVGMAKLVESSLAASSDVKHAVLRELRGDAATIDVRVAEGVSVLGSLRHQLPVAFDVIATDDDSVTIALAQPRAGSEGGVAAQIPR